MGYLEELSKELGIQDHPQSDDFEIACGDYTYLVSRQALAARSEYFEIACYVETAARENRMTIPKKHQELVRAMLRFLKTKQYYGPLRPPLTALQTYASHAIRILKGDHQTTVEFRSQNPFILEHFPEFRDKHVYQGNVAIKLVTLITSHELFQNNGAFLDIDEDSFHCEPEKLHHTIQAALYPFLREVKTRDPRFSSDPVFHANMFLRAIKYMLTDMQPVVLAAFRQGVQPWINTSLVPEYSFTSAIEIAMRRRHPTDEDKAMGLIDVVVSMMAANWGWMQHDQTVMELLKRDKYQDLLVKVQEKADALRTACARAILAAEHN